VSGFVFALALQLRRDCTGIRIYAEEMISSLYSLTQDANEVERRQFRCALTELPLDFFDAVRLLGHGSQIDKTFSCQLAIISVLEMSVAAAANS
jgi:hypothetical protein